MRPSTLVAAYAISAACAPTPQSAAIAEVAAPTSTLEAPSVYAPPPAAMAPVPLQITASDGSAPPTAASCAEADVNLDLRAWPTNVRVDTERESVYEATKFRDGIPKGAKVRVFPKSSYGFVARFDAALEHDAFAQCKAGVAAYLPGAPARHPLDHSPVVVECHRCGQDPPDGVRELP